MLDPVNKPFAAYLTGEHSLVTRAFAPVLYDPGRCGKFLRWAGSDAQTRIEEPFEVVFNGYPLWDALLEGSRSGAGGMKRMEHSVFAFAALAEKIFGSRDPALSTFIHGIANCEFDLLIRSGSRLHVFEFKIFPKGSLQTLPPQLEWQLIGEILTAGCLKHVLAGIDAIEYFLVTNVEAAPVFPIDLHKPEPLHRLVAKSQQELLTNPELTLAFVANALGIKGRVPVRHFTWQRYLREFLPNLAGMELLAGHLLQNPNLCPAS